jgi:hypothetical protein
VWVLEHFYSALFGRHVILLLVWILRLIWMARRYAGAHLWTERYDRAIDDIFVIQDEITLVAATEMDGGRTGAATLHDDQ